MSTLTGLLVCLILLRVRVLGGLHASARQGCTFGSPFLVGTRGSAGLPARRLNEAGWVWDQHEGFMLQIWYLWLYNLIYQDV